jgi:hypothetical protein
MRKILMALIIFLISTAVLATDMDINPSIVDMTPSDSRTVQVCVEKSNGSPYADLLVDVENFCKDSNANGVCDAYDDLSPLTFSISITEPTDVSGCTEATLTTSLAEEGDYAYRLKASDMVVDVLVKVASETGNVEVIPEFGVLGALTCVFAAGLFVLRRNK